MNELWKNVHQLSAFSVSVQKFLTNENAAGKYVAREVDVLYRNILSTCLQPKHWRF